MVNSKLIKVCLILTLAVLVVCNGAKENKYGVAIATSQFNTETIKLYVDGEENVINITDKSELQAILDIVNRVDQYLTVPKEEITTGMCQKWLVFDTGTTIGIHKDIDYGNVEPDIQEIGTPLYLPKGLCAYINQIIETHNQKDVLPKKSPTQVN